MTLILNIIMAKNLRNSDAGNSDMHTRCNEGLLLRGQVKTTEEKKTQATQVDGKKAA